MKYYELKFLIDGEYMKTRKDSRIRSIRFAGYVEALKMNTPFVFPKDSIFNIIKNDGDTGKKIELEGGIIVLPEGLNGQFSRDEIINSIKMSDKIHVWSIGGIFRGEYFDERNQIAYTHESMSVEVLGVSSDDIINTAEYLAHKFKQKGVMVKTYPDGNLFLVDTKL